MEPPGSSPSSSPSASCTPSCAVWPPMGCTHMLGAASCVPAEGGVLAPPTSASQTARGSSTRLPLAVSGCGNSRWDAAL